MADELKRLPTGVQPFSEIIDGGYVYVDKTALVHSLLHSMQPYAPSQVHRLRTSHITSTNQKAPIKRNETTAEHTLPHILGTVFVCRVDMALQRRKPSATVPAHE
jgi:hypothetical protein